MDSIELRESPDLYVKWPGGGGFQQVEMRINGVPLTEIVREIELPYAQREWDQDVADGDTEDDIGPRGSLAGRYLYLPPEYVYAPSENFLGAAYDHGFLTAPDDPVNGKSLLLQCTCGIIDCWFLVADITLKGDKVIWSNFQQFHRNWEYACKFAFPRDEYFAAFRAACID